MNNLNFIFFLICLTNSSFEQINDCSELKEGVFEVYENEEKIGVIYRKGNYQIEKYINREDLNYVKIKRDNCRYIFKSDSIKSDIDTLIWRVNYTKIENDLFIFEANPVNLDINYNYHGSISKKSSIIPQELLNQLHKLNESD